MSYRLEAWTLPSSGVFEKVVADLQPSSIRGGRQMNGTSTAQVVLKSDFDRLAALHNPEGDVETFLRCFDNSVPLEDFGGRAECWNAFARSTVRNYKEDGTTTISGPDIVSELETAVVFPRDWVNSFTPVKQPDWIWGADNSLLTNADFDDENIEDSTSWESGGLEGWREFGNADGLEVQEDPGDARTGSWQVAMDPGGNHSGMSKTFSFPKGSRVQFSIWMRSPTGGRRFTLGMNVQSGYTRHGLNQYTWKSKVYAELDNHARHPAGNGTPGGSTTGLWQQLKLDVTVGPNQTSTTVRLVYDFHGGPSAPLAFVDDFVFSLSAVGALEPWTGRNSTITLDDLVFNSSNFGAKIVTDGAGLNQDGIEQKVEGLIVGQQYTFATLVKHNEGMDINFTMVAARSSGGWVPGSQLWTIPSGGWHYISTTFVAESETATWSLRVAETFSITFWIDDAVGAVGLPRTTIGDILNLLLIPIQARGPIDYMTYAWDKVNDTAVLPWTRSDIGLRVARGRSIKSVLDMLRTGHGIEYEVKWTGVAYELRVFDLGRGGTDQTNQPSGKLSTDENFVGATITKRTQTYTEALAEGGELLFFHQTSGGGPDVSRQGFLGDVSYLSHLDEVSQKVLDRATADRFEVRMTLKDGERTVWSRMEVGDLMNVELEPDIAIALRVENMVLVQERESVTHVITLIREPFQEKGCGG